MADVRNECRQEHDSVPLAPSPGQHTDHPPQRHAAADSALPHEIPCPGIALIAVYRCPPADLHTQRQENDPAICLLPDKPPHYPASKLLFFLFPHCHLILFHAVV